MNPVILNVQGIAATFGLEVHRPRALLQHTGRRGAHSARVRRGVVTLGDPKEAIAMLTADSGISPVLESLWECVKRKTAGVAQNFLALGCRELGENVLHADPDTK